MKKPPVFFVKGYNPAAYAAQQKKKTALAKPLPLTGAEPAYTFGGPPGPIPYKLPVAVLHTDRYGRAVNPAGLLKPPKPKKKTVPARTPAAQLAKPGVKLPTRKVGTNTAATIPAHATTPARRSTSLTDRTPVQKAKRPLTRKTAAPSGNYGPPVAPVDTSIDAQIQAALAPGYAELTAADTRQTQQDTLARQAIQSYTNALLDRLKGVPDQVNTDYNQAIQDTTSIAGLASDRLTAAGTQSNAATQADLSAINAPQAQKDALAAQSNQVFAGGGATEFYTRGALPAQGLTANKAAQLAYARQLPLVAGLQGGQYLNKALYDASVAHQKIADQRSSLDAQIPEMRFKLQAQQAQSALAERDFGIKQQALGLNQQIARAQLGLKVQGQQFGQAATKAKLNLATLNSDRQWQATLKRLGISEAGLKLRATELERKQRTRGSKGGFTATQRQKLNADAGTLADNAYHGFTAADGTAHPPLDWGEAIREALNAGIPLKIASRSLFRYYRPGERGRPRNPSLLY